MPPERLPGQWVYLGLWVWAILFSTMVQEEDGTWRPPYKDPGVVMIPEALTCPFPFDPPQLAGQPIGQYHCPWCGSMVLAGIPHVDYNLTDDELVEFWHG
jgi:hypothetical protein